METHVQLFVGQLLNTGDALVRLLDGITDGLVRNGFERDDATAEVLAMMMGTVAARFESVPQAEIERSTELLELALEAVFADLRRAEARARRRRRMAAPRRRPV